MESHVDKILMTLPDPKNHTEMLLRIYQQSRRDFDAKTRNEFMCKKCLTPWSCGKFTIKMLSSNHKRKSKRKYLIERLKKQMKTTSHKPDLNLMRKIKRLEEQNNHVALYKCFCNADGFTKVQLRKQETNKQEIKIATSADVATTSKIELINKSKKEKKKKKKTAGLIIPSGYKRTNHDDITEPRNSSAHINTNKIRKMFEQQSIKPQQLSLHQFLK